MKTLTNAKNPIVISVIVPVYNSELYLDKCINTIIHQTCRTIEIILVNDGSTDRSFEIMESYSKIDERIILISQSNMGVSAARNAGLNIATGEYVLFVNSDDSIRNDTVEILYQHALSANAEIVIGNVLFCYPDGKQVPVYQRLTEYAKHLQLSGKQCFSQLIEAYAFPPLVFLYFAKRAFLQNYQLFFDENIVHADELWCVKTLIFARQVSVLDFFYYFYHKRQAKIMNFDFKKHRVLSLVSVGRELETFAAELQENQAFINVVGYVYVRIFYIYHAICRLMAEETNEYKKYFMRLLEKKYPALSDFQRQACNEYFNKGNSLFRNPTLSFCITCKNRFEQIRQTLPQNLKDNSESKEFIEFILVDFGSTDGLQEWIVENFKTEMEEGYLKYYYTDELQSWHASIAKNTSHLLANNDIVVNLDCDNFTGKNGGVFVVEHMKKFGWNRTVLHQFGNDYEDGSYGRIALSKSNFLYLGGYDESFEPAAYQDMDLLLRAQLLGFSYFNIADKNYCNALVNTKEKTIINTSSNLSWNEMNQRNYQLSLQKITSGKLQANMDNDHIGIIDYIYTLTGVTD